MTWFLIFVLLVMMGGVLYSLVRGIAAFLQSTREDLERDGSGPSAMQLKQNKMMFNRILFQAGAVLIVALILFAAK